MYDRYLVTLSSVLHDAPPCEDQDFDPTLLVILKANIEMGYIIQDILYCLLRFLSSGSRDIIGSRASFDALDCHLTRKPSLQLRAQFGFKPMTR